MEFNKKVSMIVFISVLFPLLWVHQVFGAQDVEIFAQGKIYHSLGEYKEEESGNNLGNSHGFFSGEDGVIADPFASSYKTFYKVGFNAGVDRAVEDFTVGNDRTSALEQVSAKDLEEALEKSFEAHDGPLLLMSDHKKVKVMALEPLESKAVSDNKVLAR